LIHRDVITSLWSSGDKRIIDGKQLHNNVSMKLEGTSGSISELGDGGKDELL
jgi:hypothetical protein